MNLAFLPGHSEILILLLIILLLFGGKKLPELARAIGRSLSEFKRGKAEGAKDELKESSLEDDEDPDQKT